MVIEVRLYAVLRQYASQHAAGTLTVEIPEGTSAAELADMLGIPLTEIKIIMVNGRHAEPAAVLTDGDRVGFFPPVGGG